jgi:hypothetical protein
MESEENKMFYSPKYFPTNVLKYYTRALKHPVQFHVSLDVSRLSKLGVVIFWIVTP